MGDILLSPAAKAAYDERNETIAKEQESNAQRDFQNFCSDRGVIANPIIQYEMSGLGGQRIVGVGIGFVSTLRIPEQPKQNEKV